MFVLHVTVLLPVGVIKDYYDDDDDDDVNYATDSCLIMSVFSLFLIVSFVLFLDFVYIGLYRSLL